MTKKRSKPVNDRRWVGARIPRHHWHFHRRQLERYQIVLGPGEFSRMVKDIRSGRALRLQQLSRGRSLYYVHLSAIDRFIYVVGSDSHIDTVYEPSKRLERLREAAKTAMTSGGDQHS